MQVLIEILKKPLKGKVTSQLDFDTLIDFGIGQVGINPNDFWFNMERKSVIRRIIFNKTKFRMGKNQVFINHDSQC